MATSTNKDIEDALDLFIGDTLARKVVPSQPVRSEPQVSIRETEKPSHSEKQRQLKRPSTAKRSAATRRSRQLRRRGNERSKQTRTADKLSQSSNTPDELPESRAEPLPPDLAIVPESAATVPRLGARRGRPKGRKSGEEPRREKRSVYIRSDIAAAYEDWSWEAKINIGQLYESALDEYLRERRRRIG